MEIIVRKEENEAYDEDDCTVRIECIYLFCEQNNGNIFSFLIMNKKEKNILQLVHDGDIFIFVAARQ
jgi:hypothetical protein